MKKKYMMPVTNVFSLSTQPLMQAVSGNGAPVNFGDAATGTDYESADSRGGGLWFDDED